MDLNKLPARVKSLDTIPERYRDAYIDDEKRGDFYLHMPIAKVIHEGDTEIARLNQQIAQVAKERATFEAERRKGVASRALLDEVEQAGVDRKMAPAAAALIAQSVEFEVEDAGGGELAIARTDTGLKSIGALVADFLLSDDGAPFRPTSSAPDEGRFAAMVAEMKRAR